MTDKETKFHSGFAALLGRPNVGKSTLMNALLGEKISIVSAHAQTTRNKITGVWNGDNAQVVFLDLWVKVTKDWKNKDYILRELGYKEHK